MATLMSDEVFHEVAYRAKNRDHLLAGVDEFLDAVTVLPPGEWDPQYVFPVDLIIQCLTVIDCFVTNQEFGSNRRPPFRLR